MTDRVQDEQVLGPEALGAGSLSKSLRQNAESRSDQEQAEAVRGGALEQSSPFGSALAPVLAEACGGRLSRVNWFRTDWQRGGALTGYGTFELDGEAAVPVVVKLPVPPRERRWLVELQAADHVAPHVYAHGEQLNGYDMAWVVMQRVPHGPLGPLWQGAEFDLLIEAAARFYAAAAAVPLAGEPARRDWEALFERARDHVHQQDVPQSQRWKNLMKKAHRKLKQWIAIWRDRPMTDWCHGDLHLANALALSAPDASPPGPAVLIDFALTHPGCWVEDAIYFEHLFWSRRDRLGGRKLCKQLAHARRDAGLEVHSDWASLAQALRGLYAATTCARLHDAGDPHHLAASLDVLESIVH